MQGCAYSNDKFEMDEAIKAVQSKFQSGDYFYGSGRASNLPFGRASDTKADSTSAGMTSEHNDG